MSDFSQLLLFFCLFLPHSSQTWRPFSQIKLLLSYTHNVNTFIRSTSDFFFSFLPHSSKTFPNLKTLFQTNLLLNYTYSLNTFMTHNSEPGPQVISHSFFFFFFSFYLTVPKPFQTWRCFSQIKLLLSHTHSLHHKLVLPVSLHITNSGRVWRKGAGKRGLDYAFAWMRSVIFHHKLFNYCFTTYNQLWQSLEEGWWEVRFGMGQCPDEVCHLLPQTCTYCSATHSQWWQSLKEGCQKGRLGIGACACPDDICHLWPQPYCFIESNQLWQSLKEGWWKARLGLCPLPGSGLSPFTTNFLITVSPYITNYSRVWRKSGGKQGLNYALCPDEVCHLSPQTF